MRLTVLGSSGSMSGPSGAASGYLLQADGIDEEGKPRTYSLTMDFGPGAMGQLLRYVNPAALDAMLFSHLHADHFVDIIGMQVYRRWYPAGPLAPVDVFSPAGGLERTRAIGGDPESETYAGEFVFHDVTPGDSITVGPMRVEFFEAQHTIETVAMRVIGPSEADAHSEVVFCFTGDTDLCESEVEAARDADLLLSEAAFEDGRDTVRGVHMTGSRAGELAARAGASRLLLTHLQPWTHTDCVVEAVREQFDGPVRAVRPGEHYRI